MNIVTTAVISNEWYLTYNETTKGIIIPPTFIDKNTSSIVGENVKIEVAQSEKELLDKIKALKLIMPKQEL